MAKKRYGRALAIAGGLGAAGALVWLLLWRGRGAITGPPEFRLDATGLSYQGKPISPGEALRRGKDAGSASVIVTGDARQGDFDALMALFRWNSVPLSFISP